MKYVTNWGMVVIDMTIIIGACFTSVWSLLLLLLFTKEIFFVEKENEK